jgi:hypothetical protein
MRDSNLNNNYGMTHRQISAHTSIHNEQILGAIDLAARINYARVPIRTAHSTAKYMCACFDCILIDLAGHDVGTGRVGQPSISNDAVGLAGHSDDLVDTGRTRGRHVSHDVVGI